MLRLLFFIISLSLAVSCQPKSEYEKVKEMELSSGIIVEDLFLELKFGMSRKEFYGTCWEHNKNGILTNGGHHLQVEYKPEMPSGKEVNMYFYPDFEDGRLYFMPIEFLYTQWFPGNDEFSNDKLLNDVIALMESWYGKGFFEVTNKNNSVRAMVKIDGNRLIRAFTKNINTVRVEILDLRVKEISEMTKDDDAV